MNAPNSAPNWMWHNCSLIAHLYGLTYEEFEQIFGTIPLVKDEVKEAALVAYQAFENGVIG